MDELQPTESAIIGYGYHEKLRQCLLSKAPSSPLQFISLPSFTPETLASVYELPGEVLGNLKFEGRFEAQVVRPEKQVHGYEGRVEDLGCRVVKKVLPVALATRLISVWRSMLVRTSYQMDDRGTVRDGVSYLFLSQPMSGKPMSGKAVNPARGTRPGLLAEIGELVVAFVETEPAKDQEILSKITKLMDDLEASIARAGAAEAAKETEGQKK